MNPQPGSADSAGSSRRAAVRDREEAVVGALHHLATQLDGEPDPAFRTATRARLVAMAAVRTPAPAPLSGWQRLVTGAGLPRWRTRLTAGLAGAALTVTALATLVAVADGAQPGDPLYGLKRGTEQTQLALAGDSRGQTLLEFARTRLDELRSLVAPTDPALILATLDTMDTQTTDAAAWLGERALDTGGTEPLEDLAEWQARQSTGLTALRPRLPDASSGAVANSLALLSAIAVRVEGLQSAVLCPTGPAVTGHDGLGPVPGPCAAAPASPAVPGTPTDPGSGLPAPTLPATPPTGGTTTGVPGPATRPGPTVPPSTGLPAPGDVIPSVPPLKPLPVPSKLPLPTTLPLPSTLPPLLPSEQGDSVITVPASPVNLCRPPLIALGDC